MRLWLELIRAILNIAACLATCVWLVIFMYWLLSRPDKVEFIWRWAWS